MKRNFIFFLFTAFCLSKSVSAQQQNFIPGEIHLTGKGNLIGLINFRDWESNPRSIQFKLNDADQKTVYTTTDLDGFIVYSHDTYQKLVAKVDMNPVEVNNVTSYDTSLLKTDTVFLRELIVAGQFKVYELIDFKKHFFLQKGTEAPKELIFRRTFNSMTSVLSTDNWFRTQIKQALGDSMSKKQKRTIDNLSYDTRSIVKFFQATLGYENQNLSSREARVLKQRPTFFLGAGVVYQKFGLSSNNNNYEVINFKPNYSYNASAGVDFFNNRGLNNLFLRLELAISELYAKGEGVNTSSGYGFTQTNYYSIKQFNLTPSVSILYNFIHLPKTKIYGGASADLNLSKYQDDTYSYLNHFNSELSVEEDYFKPEKFWIGVQAKLGAVISKRVETAVSYRFAGSFFNLTHTNETSKPLTVKVYYRF